MSQYLGYNKDGLIVGWKPKGYNPNFVPTSTIKPTYDFSSRWKRNYYKKYSPLPPPAKRYLPMYEHPLQAERERARKTYAPTIRKITNPYYGNIPGATHVYIKPNTRSYNEHEAWKKANIIRSKEIARIRRNNINASKAYFERTGIMDKEMFIRKNPQIHYNRAMARAKLTKKRLAL